MTRVDDEMMLPRRARSTGGVRGLAAAVPGPTTVFGMPAKPAAPWAPLPPTVRIGQGAASPDAIVTALSR